MTPAITITFDAHMLRPPRSPRARFSIPETWLNLKAADFSLTTACAWR
jgi:hypothetical protein